MDAVLQEEIVSIMPLINGVNAMAEEMEKLVEFDRVLVKTLFKC